MTINWDYEGIQHSIAGHLIEGEGWIVELEHYHGHFTVEQPDPHDVKTKLRNFGPPHAGQNLEMAMVRAGKEALLIAAREMGELPVCRYCGTPVTAQFHVKAGKFWSHVCTRCEQDQKIDQFDSTYLTAKELADQLARDLGERVAETALGRYPEKSWNNR